MLAYSQTYLIYTKKNIKIGPAGLEEFGDKHRYENFMY